MQLDHQVPLKTLAFVLAGGAGRRLTPLTRYRPKPLVPFGGCFRILDFTLSNCFNSGLDRVYVLTQHEGESIAAYLRRGWRTLDSNRREFAIACPPAGGTQYAGTADAILQNLSLLQTHGCSHLLVVSADHVYKMDYRKLLRFHLNNDAEATIATVGYPSEFSSEMGVIEMDAEDRVVGFEEKPSASRTDSRSSSTISVNMGVYVFNVQALLAAAEMHRARLVDIATDLIPLLLRSGNVYAYRHEDVRNTSSLYWRDLGTIQAYYDASMDLLSSRPPVDPYDNDWPIRAAGVRRFHGRSPLSEVGNEIDVNSVIPCAAHIEGASVYRSVLSMGVVLESGADVRDSVLLPGAVIKRGASVRRAIVDAHVVIEAGDHIGYRRERDQSRFHVLQNGLVVVSPDHVLPFFKTSNVRRAAVAV